MMGDTYPRYWRDETTGVLAPAVESYLLTDDELVPEHVAALRAYLRQWINAPQWARGREIDDLRAAIDGLTSRAAIDDWLAEAEPLAIDPL